MNLAFAKDSNRFSTAVEQLRKEGQPITEETIKERYELLGKDEPKLSEENVEKAIEEMKVDTDKKMEPQQTVPGKVSKKTKKAK